MAYDVVILVTTHIWMRADGIMMSYVRTDALFVGHLLNTAINFCAAIPPFHINIWHCVGFEPHPIGTVATETMRR